MAYFPPHLPDSPPPPVSPLASPLVSPLIDGFPTVPSSSATQQRASGRSDTFEVSPLLRGAPSPTEMSQSGSISSFSNTSARTNQLPSSPTNVYPPPAYVAPFGASQVVSERKRHFSDDEDDDARTTLSSRDDMQFSVPALGLLNAFLDQLLYSVLGHAKSTTLTALRPAVTEVLKSRLAAEAIASAEEELQELLAGGEDEEEEMNQRQTVAERNRTWDTELVWKRTRLRVMVYIRLGEMEDDDEERYVRDDDLFHHSDRDRRFSHSTGLVSWAAAIFLTSVLEYVAEQVLQVAGQAADTRARRQSRNPRVSMSASGMVTPVHSVTVEDYDMEKVALNSTLGRLWRTWRKSLRNTVNGAPPTPATSGNNFSRRFSRDVLAAGLSPNQRVTGGDESVPAMDDTQQSAEAVWDGDAPGNNVDELPEAQYPEHVLAANIPLPLTDSQRDVDEIEVPGLARDPDNAETDGDRTPKEPRMTRRNSVTGDLLFRSVKSSLAIETAKDETDPGSYRTLAVDEAVVLRKRAVSLPSAFKSLFFPPDDEEAKSKVNQDDEGTEGVKSVEQTAEENQPLTAPSEGSIDSEAKSSASASEAVQEKEEVVVERNPSKAADTGIVFDKAAAGSAAAAAAAVTAVYGPKFDKKKPTKNMPVVDTDIDERDNQKLLVDVKRLSNPVVVKKQEPPERKEPTQEQERPQTAKRISLTPLQTPAIVVRTKSRSPTPDSFSLLDKEAKSEDMPIAKPQHLLTGPNHLQESQEEAAVDIGVARTSDTAVSTPRAEEAPEWRYARDSFTHPAPRRQSRLILGADAPSSPEAKVSPLEEKEDDVTPRSFLEKRALAVTTKSRQTERSKTSSQSPHEKTRSSAPKSPNLASAPTALVLNSSGASPQPSPLEKTPSPWRQSFSAATANGSWASLPKKSTSISEPAVPVQEHPVVQKIASIKNADSSKPKEEERQPLVSASIKGPEDFEMFVQGGDTVKYTLTPENVRDRSSPIDAVPHSVVKGAERTSTQTPPSDVRLGRSHSTKHATSATPMPPEPPNADIDVSSNKEKRRSISRPPVRNTSVHRRSGLIAREPQVMTESTRDFADFIRSTGPTKEPEISLLASKSTTSLHSMRYSFSQGSRSSSPGGRSLNRVPMPTGNIPPLPPMPGKGKSLMQPRAPTSNTDSGTSELIDFIRSGPNTPSEVGQPRQHRISRSVAPFRTTMDSDQLNEWGDRLAVQPDLKLDTKINAAPSLKSASSLKTDRTSANSRSALLSNSNTHESVHPAHSGQPQRLSGKPLSAPPEPRRYRGKDPYPIDFLDDEDDDLLTALPKNSKREEESLVDFLRNSEPPAENSLRAGGSQSRQAVGPRKGSIPGQKTSGTDSLSMDRRASAPAKDIAPSRTVANMAAPRVQGTTSIAVGPMSKPRSQLEARGLASAKGGSTTDLANFLRTSTPLPPPTPNKPPVALRQNSKLSLTSSSKSKKSSRISGLFSGGFFSRKPAAGRTYLDM